MHVDAMEWAWLLAKLNSETNCGASLDIVYIYMMYIYITYMFIMYMYIIYMCITYM